MLSAVIGTVSCVSDYPPGSQPLSAEQLIAEQCLIEAWRDATGTAAVAEDFTATFLPAEQFHDWCAVSCPTRWDQSGGQLRAYSCYWLDTDTIIIHAGALTDQCPWQYTTLQHEMAHAFSYQVYGLHDYSHNNRLIWDVVLPDAWARCHSLCEGG